MPKKKKSFVTTTVEKIPVVDYASAWEQRNLGSFEQSDRPSFDIVRWQHENHVTANSFEGIQSFLRQGMAWGSINNTDYQSIIRYFTGLILAPRRSGKSRAIADMIVNISREGWTSIVVSQSNSMKAYFARNYIRPSSSSVDRFYYGFATHELPRVPAIISGRQRNGPVAIFMDEIFPSDIRPNVLEQLYQHLLPKSATGRLPIFFITTPRGI